MEKILDVPFHAQDSDDSCGIAVTRMVLDFLGEGSGMENLTKEAIAIGGRTEYGWSHESLVRLLHNHGVSAYPQEYRSVSVDVENKIFTESTAEDFIDKGIQKIILKIDEGLPTIISVKEKFNDNIESHLILITGYGDDTLYYHDPDSRKGVIRNNEPVSISDFKKYWKKFAIFVD